MRFALYADAEVIGFGRIRQRVAVQNRRFTRIHLQPENQKLTRPEKGESFSLARDQGERRHAIAFLADTGNSHLFESGPGWSLLFIRESWIALHGSRARLLFEHRQERTLPALAEGRNLECSFQLFGRMPWQIQESVNLGHRHPF